MKKQQKLKVLALIGARGGSQGLYRKNIALLLGKPLIYYTIKAAKDSKYINRIVVSTDDKEIARIATQEGAEIPFLRPKNLAGNSASAESFLKHAVEWLEKKEGYIPDIVVYLQLTDLRRKKGIIDKCVKKLIANKKMDSVFVGTPTHKKYWKSEGNKYVRVTPTEYEPRQIARNRLFREDTGIACATRPEIIKQGKRVGDNVGIIIDYGPDVDIHDYLGLKVAEIFLVSEIVKGDSEYFY